LPNKLPVILFLFSDLMAKSFKEKEKLGAWIIFEFGRNIRI